MSIRVLIVDDETMVRMGLVAFFEDEGFEVRSASGAEEALRLLEAEAFDAAIVDIRLRDSDGEHFILRGHAMRPQTHFLIHTGSILYRVPPALAAIGLTDADVIHKPARLRQLADRIRAEAEGK